jgi:hypothetical protein
MMIGAHSIIYSTDADKDRAFIRDVLKLPYVDVGSGWLIFGLPSSELAIHPSKRNNIQEFYLMCDDINELICQMKELKIKCTKVQRQRWGLMTKLRLPGGGDLKIYEPMHARPRMIKKQVSRKKRPPISTSEMGKMQEHGNK